MHLLNCCDYLWVNNSSRNLAWSPTRYRTNFMSPMNCFVIADSVCKMKPSGLHNGFRLNQYWALHLCLFVLATRPYPNLRAQLAQLSLIWLQTTWQHHCLSVLSVSFSAFCPSLLVKSLSFVHFVNEIPALSQVCVQYFDAYIVCTLCLALQRKREANGQVWEIGCGPPVIRGSFEKDSKERGRRGLRVQTVWELSPISKNRKLRGM